MAPSPHSLLCSSSSLPSILFSPLNNNNKAKRSLHFSSSSRCRCSVLSSTPSPSVLEIVGGGGGGGGGIKKPSPAENSRTIMELSSSGTLSTPPSSPDDAPSALGAQFVADADGSPALCLPRSLPASPRATFHVQLEQCRSRTSHCTLMGTLNKPDDEMLLKKLNARWKKKFGEEIHKDLVYLISVERVLHMEDFNEEGIWVPSSEYSNAEPDPLRNFAEKIVDEMNSGHAEDVRRLCNIFVDSGFQVTDTKMIWVDRLGFDLYIYSEKGVFAARITFPREVTDEKGVKSSFNSMSHLAWEVEKNYTVPEFEKVKCLKKIR
ncbi:glutamyl-tRNA reductase-binding protein, chloroplastic [Iris pallida]|uniref:Glutamyl-tRNA reductase-binding protein, chloroplastic n=1 Tax=Iris pallida TaxID=29817 RepID=A0AAX6E3J3_IRIPA|nr:glutamyl-tRNA reductase-binding protein, chloroplastic [Iris pallida]